MMKNSYFLLVLIIFLLSGIEKSNAQPDLQSKIKTLKVGKTTFNELTNLFGKPDRKIKRSSWVDTSSTASSFKKSYALFKETNVSSSVINLYEFEFLKSGLSFFIFDKTNELYSIEITNPQIFIHQLKVGDNLKKLTEELGENDEWTSTDESDYWTLSFEKLGLNFIFERDKKAPKYPMKLDKAEHIIRIEIFDSNISLTS